LIEDGFLLSTFRVGFAFSGELPEPAVALTEVDPKPKPDGRSEGAFCLAGSGPAAKDGLGNGFRRFSSFCAFDVCSS
jgi:hypothetical protein